MAVLNNKIYIGSLTEPEYYFENDDITNIEFDNSVDVVADKLAIDVQRIKVKHIATQTANLRLLPYGTPVWWYVGNDLKAKFYSENVEREEYHYYIINCISAIGILDKQYYHGGVYNGELCGDIIAEIIGDTVPFTISQDVARTELYGYLPYDTCRRCLHEIIYAEGISILKNADGDMLFTYAAQSQADTISQDEIFLEGKIKYPAIPSKLNVVEHSYQYVDTVERVTLFDNTDGNPVTGQVIYFDTAPIAPESLQTSEGLTIGAKNANFASLTGQGILTGIPYYDKQKTITRTFSGGQGFTKTISERTLVTAANSENVADRLLSYYTSVEDMEADTKAGNLSCGNRYSFVNKYGEQVTAFLTRVKGNVSSFIRGSCEFIAGYNPQTLGNVYNYERLADVNGYFQLPNGVKILRMLIIGGGDGGDSGLSGENKEAVKNEYTGFYWGAIEGCKGGEPGEAGNGGWIKEIVIRNPQSGQWNVLIGNKGIGGTECESETVTEKGTNGGHTKVTSPSGTVYSTQDSDAYRSKYGVKSLLSQTVYAKKGHEGVKGGDGGDGSKNGNGEDGEDVEFNGKIQKGGKGGKCVVFDLHHISKTFATGGAGGSGAQAVIGGFTGENADAYIKQYDDLTAYPYSVHEEVEPVAGMPHSPIPYYLPQNYSNGDGGDAGHGGAGRGGFGSSDQEDFSNASYAPNGEKQIIVYAQSTGYSKEQIEQGFRSSRGAAGKDGMHGICLFYTDKWIDFVPDRYNAPTLSNIFVADDWKIKFTITAPTTGSGGTITSGSYGIFYRFRVSDDSGESPSWGAWSEWQFIQNVSFSTESAVYYRQLTAPNQAVEYEFYAITNASKPTKEESLMSSTISKAIYRLPSPTATFTYSHIGDGDYINITMQEVEDADNYVVDITKGTATEPIWRYTAQQRSISCLLPEPIEIGQTYKISVYVNAVGHATSEHRTYSYVHHLEQLTRPVIESSYDDQAQVVTVSWDYDERASKYEVHRSAKDSTEWEDVFETQQTPFIDNTMEIGHRYYYMVKAIGDGITYEDSEVSIPNLVITY